MSKAFTRESDDAPRELPLVSRESQLPPGTRNYLTPEGAARLDAELARVTAERAALPPDATDTAHSIDRRIRELEDSLALAEVVDPRAQDPSRVSFGATVTVRDADDRERRYQIVGIDEADAREHRISWLSPLAKALLNQRVGDVVTFRSPRGEEELEIVRIEYGARPA